MPRAPRRCPGDDYTCTQLVKPGQHHCPEHTLGWREQTGSSRITATTKWRTLRSHILRRDGYRCRIATPGVCTGHATHVDKITPAAQQPGLALDPTNLRAACAPCNEHKGRTTDKATP